MLIIDQKQCDPAKRVVFVQDWNLKSRMSCAFDSRKFNKQVAIEVKQFQKRKQK